MDRRALGNAGEQAAARYLESRGLRIIDRGWRARTGEIDLVARDGDEVVFVEVKTRMPGEYGAPEEAVTAAKRRSLRATACLYLDAHGLSDAAYRIDVVAVTIETGNRARIRHILSAVDDDD